MKKYQNTVKRITAIILCALFVCSSLIMAFAVDTEYTYGDYTYTLNESGATITAYPETAKGSVSIPQNLGSYTVTEIGTYAFYACTLITDVKVPTTVTKIGDYAFAYCTTLASIEIPASVTEIGKREFFASNKVEDIYYEGSEADWDKIDINSDNENLFAATVHYGVEITSYTLTYNANGGSGVPAQQTGSTSYTISGAKPTRSGYNFLGWSTSSSAIIATYGEGSTIVLDSDTTLYAVWQKITYKLSYSSNGGMGMIAMQTGDITYTIRSIEPTRSGYTFLGWSKSKTATTATYFGGDSITLSEDTTLYAVWRKNDAYALDDSEIFSFANSSRNFTDSRYDTYYVSDGDFAKLSNYIRNIYDNPNEVINMLQDSRNQTWGGSCYGMAAVTVLDKYGHIAFNENFDAGAPTMRDVDVPVANSNVLSAINYYFIAQGITDQLCHTNVYTKGTPQWEDGLRNLVRDAQNGKAMMFGYYFSGGGHEIVIKGYKKSLTSGEHRLIAYDNRYPERNVNIVIDRNYNTCTVEADRDEAVYKFDYFYDFSGFDRIDIDGPDNSLLTRKASASTSTAIENNTTTILLPATDNITVENKAGQKLICSAGIISGDMEVLSERMIVNSTADGNPAPGTVMVEVQNSDSFTFEGDSEETQVSIMSPTLYARSKTKNADEVTITENEGILITGENFDYDTSISLNNAVCDMVSVSGEAKDGTSLIFKDDGLILDGGAGNKEITVFSNTTDTENIAFTSAYDTVLIAGSESGATGKVDVLASSEGNDNFDVKLVEESVAINPIELNKMQLDMRYKSSAVVTAEITDPALAASEIQWFSSDESVATVSADGTVSAVGVGTAEITARIKGTDIQKLCTVNVSYTWWQWIIRILLLGFLWY